MKKILFFLITLFLFLFLPNTTVAQEPPFDCGFYIECVEPVDCTLGPTEITQGTEKVKFHFDLNKIPKETWNSYPDLNPKNNIPDILDDNLNSFPYNSSACYNRDQYPKKTTDKIEDERPMGSFDCDFQAGVAGGESAGNIGLKKFFLRTKDASHNWFDLCVGNYSIVAPSVKVEIKIESLNGKYDIESEWKVIISFPDKTRPIPVFSTYLDDLVLNSFPFPSVIQDRGTLSAGNDHSDVYFTLKPLAKGAHFIKLYSFTKNFAQQKFDVLEKGQPTPTLVIPTPTLIPGAPTYTPVPPVPSLAPLCDQIDPQFSGKCWDCINKGAIWTAIGCLPTDFSNIVNNYFLKFGIGIAGGIAFLYFISGVFLIMTSAGNAEKVTQAKEIIVSAISGLLLIIFSIFLLKIIGVDILKIPGLGG